MALPANVITDEPPPSVFLEPDDRVRSTLLVDYELGGVALGDPSQGLQVQAWEARVSGDVVQVRPDGAGGWTDVFSATGITEVALAFDQNMRPTVAFVADGVAKLRWFDAVAAAYVVSTFPEATSPVVTLDDKRAMQIGLNDVLLFYLRGGRVYHRLQRERYLIERDMAAVPEGMTRITRWGMTEANRVQLEFGAGPADPEAPGPAGPVYGVAYTDLRTDTLYVVDGTEVVPLLDDGTRDAVWVSRIFTLTEHPSFAWLRINGDMAAPARVRLWADGALWWSSGLISTREPVRVRPGRARLWQLQVESQARVTSVAVASSVEELNA